MISTYYDIESGNETALLEAVATKGPISVGIVATDNFQHYASGNLNYVPLYVRNVLYK